MKRSILYIADLKSSTAQYQDMQTPYATKTSKDVAAAALLKQNGIRYEDVEWKQETTVPYPSAEACIFNVHHMFGIIQGSSRVVSLTFTD